MQLYIISMLYTLYNCLSSFKCKSVTSQAQINDLSPTWGDKNPAFLSTTTETKHRRKYFVLTVSKSGYSKHTFGYSGCFLYHIYKHIHAMFLPVMHAVHTRDLMSFSAVSLIRRKLLCSGVMSDCDEFTHNKKFSNYNLKP